MSLLIYLKSSSSSEKEYSLKVDKPLNIKIDHPSSFFAELYSDLKKIKL